MGNTKLNWQDYTQIAEALSFLYPEEDLGELTDERLMQFIGSLEIFNHHQGDPPPGILTAIFTAWVHLQDAADTTDDGRWIPEKKHVLWQMIRISDSSLIVNFGE